MSENINYGGGIVGSVVVTTVNSVPPNTGTYMTGSDAGLSHQVDGVSVAGVQSSGMVNAESINTSMQQTGGTLPVTANVKKTSFQITSVTVDSSASNDGGDDSADDLDESHTEDSSDVATDASRHTSESRAGGGGHTTDDNFTRNDIFYNPAPPSSMNIAPVIPTSSQYGLAIVPEGLNNPANEPPPPAPAIINDAASEKTDSDKDIVHNRFKVVKIVSTEPFKKGRWMCMDYFDHTTTTTGTTSTVKDTTPSQPSQQPVPQSQTHSNVPQPGTDKVPVNVVNIQQQGSNVTMTSSPPQPSHMGMNNANVLPPDSQQQTTIIQQTQSSQHILQQQLQNAMHDQDGSVSSTGLPNGNGTHYHDYHVNHSHNVQGVNLNHVASASSVINNNPSDSSAFSTSIPNHNPSMSTGGNTYQNSIGQQQQQQQQYYNNAGVLTGIPSRPVNVAPASSIPNQQQQPTIAPQQPSMTSQQQPRPITGQVPIGQNQTQPQGLGQIGPQSSISQNTSVPLISQTMPASQMHQTPVQVTQPSHLPAQSLPHGAHAQMTGTTSIVNNPPSGPPAPQQHSAQSLGHNMLQNKPAFMNAPQHQQSQTSASNQFQQQPGSQQQQPQQLMSTAQQQSMMGNQQNSNQPVGQVSQTAPTQQQQPQSYQGGVMMQNMQGIQQQVHVQQMNAANVSQHSVPIQQPQPTGQAQGIYTTPGQMMGHTMQMGGQAMNMQQNTQPIMQQPNVIQNQTMMQQQQQQQMVGQQHHQQMMSMPPQQQPIVSQPQTNVPQQPIMSQPQMMSQMMQNTQMSGMVNQTPLVSQPGVLPQQQGMSIPQQQNMMQQMPQQPNYPSQAQPQTINNQASMQQSMMQQYPQQQQQTNPVIQQQQMMPPQNQSNIMAPQMGQQMTQGQQIPHQQQQQQSQPNQQQSNTQQQQQQPPQQVSIQQPQQTVYQNPPQQIQVSQANVGQSMNMQNVHNIMPPVPQNIQQIPTPGGIPIQGSSIESVASSSSISSSEPPNQQQQQQQFIVEQQQQQQPIIQQQQPQPIVQQQTAPPVSVTNQPQVQPTPTAVTASPAEVHVPSQQNPPATAQVPSAVSTTTSSAPSPAITSLSAAATVIIEGVNSLAEAAVGGGGNGNEDGESATGTNTVAIDNKIEQAMDLVKSHLMFAVREEVEVLKEKISELMERISQLEYENTILRANASQETLAQLQLQKSNQHPAPNVNESHQGFS